MLNEPLAAELGLDPAYLRDADGVRLLIGNLVPGGATPVAQAYAGHQFGWLAPRLGDGRALLLGEITDADGHLRDVHLKGSGRTPFARGGDGLAGGRPDAAGVHRQRSDARHGHPHHAVPRRRGDGAPGAPRDHAAGRGAHPGRQQPPARRQLPVRPGHGRPQPPAPPCRPCDRPAPSPAPREAEQPYLALFQAVVAAQASLVARWMLVGFVHGVMNTDNMTISGETIDYGPCAFLDAFDPAAVYSSIDETGRYAYRNQPLVAEWNLTRLAESLLPLFHDEQEQAVALAQESLAAFRRQYSAAWSAGMQAKLGLPDGLDDGVASPLVDELLSLLQAGRR